MIITEIVTVGKSKCKVITDSEIAFVIYKGDLHKYELKCGEEISRNVYDTLFDEILPNRAFNRLMKLLLSKDYTHSELITKLRRDGYPDSVISKAIERIDEYGYVNDERYTKGYIESHVNRKSRETIKRELLSKGISKDRIDEAFEELTSLNLIDDETESIKKLLCKRHFDFENADYEAQKKEIQYLFRKGYKLSDIKKVINSVCDYL